MAVKSYRDLLVWQRAMALIEECLLLLPTSPETKNLESRQGSEEQLGMADNEN
jgi:hypothetical protein